jgi:hypothetical protein
MAGGRRTDMPKQKGARKVSKAEMVRFLDDITYDPYCHNEPKCICARGKLKDDGTDCDKCKDGVVSAIIQLIKAHKEA